MKLSKSFLFLLLITLVLLSCKKESSEEAQIKTTLPNYGNVDLDDVFTRKDNKLENKDSITAVLHRYYKNVWEKGDLWGGFIVAKGDEILYENYRGFAQDKQQEPINDTVALHVASVSKTLTAMATLKLVEAGKIKLEDPLTKYFPKFPYPKVTVFTLLSQRSGLPKYEHFVDKIKPAPAELSKKFLTNQDILNMLIQYQPELARNTDTGFMYCNTNYALLALLIEKVTGKTFPEAMKQMVFRPLKMKNSYIFQEKDTLTAAKSFYQRGPKVYPYDQLDLIYGDKNVYTTPRDLLNFSKALYSKEFLRADLKEKIFEPYSNERPGINNYGLGFRMKIFNNNEKLTYHNGWWHGTNSVFAHLLKSKVTIIAIGNKYSTRVYSALALSGLFENLPYEKEKIKKMLNETDTLKQNQANDSYSE
ncbi:MULTISPECIES: serine hydrolase [Chryseobacterium]|uniref:Penicillin-binding protein 4 n=1 Tax=Chryseobacterium salivictor TaxID=2547600 RepID=A0A4P6ZDV0_9FLAO|nr:MULTISPECIES: serine hydrolase domain-containing protein [Chryseobacterium]MDQ0476657.1 CubicO group peptidase (beta-lactamase class C family) [Chryseobacterium sp. MDT2-18]QBO57562.1 Penicillin-binding protein 4* [Chryseobacterium salivictor]